MYLYNDGSMILNSRSNLREPCGASQKCLLRLLLKLDRTTFTNLDFALALLFCLFVEESLDFLWSSWP